MDPGFQFETMKSSGDDCGDGLANSVNGLEVTELCT